MQTILTPKQAEISILKTRLDALEETHAFIAMYYAFRAAQLLDEWRLAEEEAGDEERATSSTRSPCWGSETSRERA